MAMCSPVTGVSGGGGGGKGEGLGGGDLERSQLGTFFMCFDSIGWVCGFKDLLRFSSRGGIFGQRCRQALFLRFLGVDSAVTRQSTAVITALAQRGCRPLIAAHGGETKTKPIPKPHGKPRDRR